MGLPEKYLYAKDTRFVNYKDFVNLELVLFSNADNIRSIPCLVDGLKPGQRKASKYNGILKRAASLLSWIHSRRKTQENEQMYFLTRIF